ncbi:MAG: hypothetical protein MUO35_03415 [Anaerolineales bacterium]|nr:hypothetical protein [Anaerolineales bacterium]
MAIKLGAQDLRIISEITKTTPQADGSLLLEGVATSEVLDAEGEIMDYETAKAAMLAWRGNVREQHDPRKAVGRALEVLPDDQARAIPIKVMVSAGAPDTQAKVLDGTLKFFSIGGRAKAKELDKVVKRTDGKPAVRVMLDRVSEVSLVDSGCNPGSAVSVLKAADMLEVEKINAPKIVVKDGKFLVVDSDGHVYGTHDNDADAKKQLAALYAAKGREEKVMEEETIKTDKADTGVEETSLLVADGSVDPTLPAAPEPPPVVKQEDTPPPEPGEEPEPEPEPVVPEPPAVSPETEKAVTEPAKDDGLVMKGLVEKVEAMTGELATLKADLVTNKADLVTKGEENATLRKQVGDLQATVEKLGKRVVEPGTPVFKGPDGKPTTQPQGTAADMAISVEKITELVKAANGDPAVLQRSLGMEIAQAQVRKALTGRQ